MAATFPIPEGSIIVMPGGPDNTLPGVPPGVDNSLPGVPRPVDPGYGIPLPPVTVWPTPPHAGQPLPISPTYPIPPGHIDNSLPTPPGSFPKPPGSVWPPLQPVYPSHPIYLPPGGMISHPIAPGGETPSHPIAMPPGSVWPPLPGLEGPVVALVWFVGYGYRWGSFDPSLSVGYPLPTPPAAHADQELPPVAQPRRG